MGTGYGLNLEGGGEGDWCPTHSRTLGQKWTTSFDDTRGSGGEQLVHYPECFPPNGDEGTIPTANKIDRAATHSHTEGEPMTHSPPDTLTLSVPSVLLVFGRTREYFLGDVDTIGEDSRRSAPGTLTARVRHGTVSGNVAH